MENYLLTPINKNKFQIATFEYDKEPKGVYTITKRGNNYFCDCMGYYRQKKKEEHKHCLVARFWIENLEKELGYVFWFEGSDIEFNRFINLKEMII